MAISTAVKDRPASNRYMLVRLEPAFYAVDDLAATGTANLYDATFEVSNVSKVTRNGVELTEVSDEPNSDGEWRYVESTKTFELYTTTAPHETNANIVVYYYLFLTGEKTRYADETPTDTASPVREWEPLLISYPSINTGLSKVYVGVVSANNTSLNFFNVDQRFVSHKSSPNQTDLLNLSMSDKKCAIWLGIDDNYKRVFNGIIKSIRNDQNQVQLNVYDELGKLEKTAFMGDDRDDSLISNNTTGVTNIFTDTDEGKPIKFVFGHTGHRMIVNNVNGTNIQAGIHGTDDLTNASHMLSVNETEQAICVNYVPIEGGTYNREWYLCKTDSSGLSTVDIGTPISITVTNDTESFRRTRLADGPAFVAGKYGSRGEVVIEVSAATYEASNLLPGDTVSWSVVGFASGYARIKTSYYFSGSNTWKYYCFADQTYSQPSDPTTYTTGLSVSSATPIVSISISDNGSDLINCIYGVDYTLSEVSLPSGNKIIKATFTNNFENTYRNTSVGGNGFFNEESYLNPRDWKVYYRVHAANDVHANVAKTICERAGLTTGGNFDHATKWLPGATDAHKISFSIPNYRSENIERYSKYLSDVCKSVFSIIKTDSENSIADYVYPENNETIELVLDESTVLNNTISYNITYKDLSTKWATSNSQFPLRWFPDAFSVPSSANDYIKQRYLHGDNEQTTRFEHVLNKVITRPLDVLSNRVIEYMLTTATDLANIEIGDRITLNLEKNIGGLSVNVYVISIRQEASKTTITCIDTGGL